MPLYYRNLWTECVLDATMDREDGLHVFCPIEGDISTENFSVVTGDNYISTDPPEGLKLVAIVHADGEKAVQKWVENNREEYDRLRKKYGSNK